MSVAWGKDADYAAMAEDHKSSPVVAFLVGYLAGMLIAACGAFVVVYAGHLCR